MLLNEATYRQILAADLEKAAPPGETCLLDRFVDGILILEGAFSFKKKVCVVLVTLNFRTYA